MTKRAFDDVERTGCVVRTLQALKNSPKIIVSSFAKAGLLCGCSDLKRHFPASKFNAGTFFRDVSLTRVSSAYIAAVLSLRNLTGARAGPVEIPESAIYEQLRTLAEYAHAGAGFRKLYFALRISADTAHGSENDSAKKNDTNDDEALVITTGVRKLFKLGKARNMPRGAPDRVSTAYGSLASARDQWLAALKAEEAAREIMA